MAGEKTTGSENATMAGRYRVDFSWYAVSDQRTQIETQIALGIENGENVKPCDENIKKTLELVKDMISIVEKGDADREDDG